MITRLIPVSVITAGVIGLGILALGSISGSHALRFLGVFVVVQQLISAFIGGRTS